MATRMKDFIYSIYINKEDDNAETFSLKLSKSDDSFWTINIDFTKQVISIGNEEVEVLKSTDHYFVSNREYKIDVVVNDGIIKTYIDENDVASIVFSLGEHLHYEVSDNISTNKLTCTNKTITNLNSLTGDVYCGGYEVSKIINLTDGNYKLTNEEYSIIQGTINISEEYLNTLENDTEYCFRAVTSLTDLDFYVKTKEVGVQVTPLVNRYYRGDDIKFELSEVATVNKAFIDNNEFEFELENTVLTIKSEELDSISSGEHLLKLFTNNGRPEAKFSLYSTVETIPEVPAPVSYMFLFIDIAIFGVLIVGYILFTQLKRFKK